MWAVGVETSRVNRYILLNKSVAEDTLFKKSLGSFKYAGSVCTTGLIKKSTYSDRGASNASTTIGRLGGSVNDSCSFGSVKYTGRAGC